MRRRETRRAERLFQRLLSLYPVAFRDEYGREMTLVFADRYRDAATGLGQAHLWAQVVSGILREAPKEHARLLAADLRHAGRTLGRSPAVTVAMVVTLALGLGANTAVFSVLDAVVLRTLSVPDPEQLHAVKERSPYPLPESDRYSHPQFERFGAALPPGAAIAAASRVARMPARLAGRAEADVVRVQLVSPAFFDVLGIVPRPGRAWRDQPLPEGGHEQATVVISHALWQRQLAGAADAVGSTITIADVPLAIVGVAPAGFRGIWLELPVDVWAPLHLQQPLGYAQAYHARNADDAAPWRYQDGVGWLDVFARAQPAAEGPLASALNGVFRQDTTAAAEAIADSEERRRRLERHLALEPMAQGLSSLRDRFSAPLWALQGMACIVLLVACLNTAHLLLARAVTRRRELAIRMSLGAGRSRLVQRLLVESALLVSLAAGLGLLLARWGVDVFAHMAVQSLPGLTELSIDLDARVLLFTGITTVVTVLAFGVAPAFFAVRTDVAEALKATDARVRARTGLPAGRTLVVVQIALSVLLVAAAGLLGRSLHGRLVADLGFEPDRVLSVELQYRRFATAELPAVHERIERELEALPGVQSVSTALCGLAAGCGWFSALEFEGYERPAGERSMAQLNVVTPRYFETVGMRSTEGRLFDARDTEQAPLVAIVNETLARRYFSGRSAVGQRLGYTDLDTTIVGVVADARVTNVKEDPVPFVFFPLRQRVFPPTSIEVRTALAPASIGNAVRAALARAAPELRVESIVPLTSQVQRNVGQERLALALTSGYALLALVLAAVGLFSTLSYAVASRRHELAVRLALGAPPGRLQRTVLGEALTLSALGTMIGVPLAIGAAAALDGLLYGVRPFDPASVGGTVLVLALVSLAAALRPAWHASRVDPLMVLRNE